MIHDDRRGTDAALVRLSEAATGGAVATIVSTRGSTPRKSGARMVLDANGVLSGTVGGGCGEAEVIEAAGRVMESGRAEMVRVDLTDDLASWSPAVCGGTMDVFVEPLRSSGAPPAGSPPESGS